MCSFSGCNLVDQARSPPPAIDVVEPGRLLGVIWLVLLVGGLVLFAGVFDLVVRARGSYRPVADWEAARLRRKERGRNLRPGRSR